MADVSEITRPFGPPPPFPPPPRPPPTCVYTPGLKIKKIPGACKNPRRQARPTADPNLPRVVEEIDWEEAEAEVARTLLLMRLVRNWTYMNALHSGLRLRKMMQSHGLEQDNINAISADVERIFRAAFRGELEVAFAPARTRSYDVDVARSSRTWVHAICADHESWGYVNSRRPLLLRTVPVPRT